MPYNNGPMILGITWMESGLAIIAVAVRFFARVTITNNVGIEDWTMLLAILLQLLGQLFLTMMVYWGLGRHMITLSLQQMVEYRKWSVLFELPGVLSTSLARVSIAILLLRLFGVKVWFRWYLYLMTALQMAAALTLLIVWGAQCRPFSALWEGPYSSCWDPNIDLIIASVFQSICTVIDLTYVLFPVTIVWHLSLKPKDKLILITVLSFGLLAMVASIVKTIENLRILNQHDPSYDLTDVSIWMMTEQNLVIIVGCVPVWRSLFTANSSKELTFNSLLSKYFPHRPELRNSTSDLEALHGAHEVDRISKVPSNTEILPIPPEIFKMERKNSMELPSLELIGRPSERSGSP